RQPQEDRRILADGPQHAQVFEVAERLPEDVHALLLELVQVVHDGPPPQRGLESLGSRGGGKGNQRLGCARDRLRLDPCESSSWPVWRPSWGRRNPGPA